jgi:hypothetical protein
MHAALTQAGVSDSGMKAIVNDSIWIVASTSMKTAKTSLR